MPTLFSSEKTPQICIIGAGLSGLCAAVQLKSKLGLTSFTILERNNDVGGTWLVNTYPGCACDVQSHLYSYSFEPNAEWSSNFATQPEILKYIKATSSKHNLYHHIQFGTEVRSLTWDNSITKWRVVSKKQSSPLVEEHLYDVVVNAPGLLHEPKIPTEFLSFKGRILHSAEWDSQVKLDKTTNVAVIGSGSSAVQIIPAIAEHVKELHAFQREPAWVWPRSQFVIPGFVKTVFSYIPFLMWLYRCFLFCAAEIQVNGFKSNNLFQYIGTWTCQFKLNMQLLGNKQTELVNKLSPKHSFGCRRISVSSNYYSAFALPNVFLHRKPIVKVNEHSICTAEGEKTSIDVLILATGFKAQDYFAPMSIIGMYDENILYTWQKKGPSLYAGLVGNSIPNLFILLGPHSQLGHNSLIFQLECQVELMIKLISEMMERKTSKIVVKTDAVDNYMKEMSASMKGTVWNNENCGSWYANSRNEVTLLWPASCSYFWMKTRKVEFSNFEFS